MKDFLVQLCAMQRWFSALYHNEESGFVGIDKDKVQLTSAAFSELFQEYTQSVHSAGYMKREAVYDGVTFMALFEKEDRDEHV